MALIQRRHFWRISWRGVRNASGKNVTRVTVYSSLNNDCIFMHPPQYFINVFDMYVRHNISLRRLLLQEITCLFLLLLCPAFLWFYWISYNSFGASLVAAASALWSETPYKFFLSRLPRCERDAFYVYFAWVAFQGLLFVCLPGPSVPGPRTPGGIRHVYKLNGLTAWILTILLAVSGSLFGFIKPSYIATHWDSLLVAASFWCFLLICAFQVKAHLFPDNASDTLITGKYSPLPGTRRENINPVQDTLSLIFSTVESCIRAGQVRSIGSILMQVGRAVCFYGL